MLKKILLKKLDSFLNPNIEGVLIRTFLSLGTLLVGIPSIVAVRATFKVEKGGATYLAELNNAPDITMISIGVLCLFVAVGVHRFRPVGEEITKRKIPDDKFDSLDLKNTERLDFVNIETLIGSELLKNGIDNLTSRLFEVEKKKISKEELKVAIEFYADKYIAEYGTIKVLGMSKPISVTSIYTSVRASNYRFKYDFSNIHELENNYIDKGLRGLRGNESGVNAIEAANKNQLLNILGAPGAGKTTFLKRVGIDALTASNKSTYTHNLIPVFIELKLIKEKEPNLLNIVFAYLSEFGFPEENKLIETMLKEGSFVFLLDGLDEVEKEFLIEVTKEVKRFQKKYDNNRFITSCRTAFYSNYFNTFTDVYLLDFDEAQIDKFSENWFKSISYDDVHVGFLEQIKSERNKAAYELAKTPLLLTFLCIVYSKTLAFPVNRASLYKKALETLLHDWLAEKQVQIFDAFDGLHVDLEVLMLASFAGPMFELNTFFFSEEDISISFSKFLQEELNAPKQIDAKKIVKVIEQKQGILVERSHGVYSFSHLTIHEYLSAIYYKEFGEIECLVDNFASEKRWREVFLLLSGMGNADRLIMIMYDKCETILRSHDKLLHICKWLSNSLEIDYKDVDSVFEMTLAFSKFAESSWIYRGKKNKYYSDLRDQCESITKSIIEIFGHEHNTYKPAKVRDKRDIKKEYSKAGLSSTYMISSWNNKELESAAKYFSIYNLIIECKQASLSIGHEQWNLIINNFLSAGSSNTNRSNKALQRTNR